MKTKQQRVEMVTDWLRANGCPADADPKKYIKDVFLRDFKLKISERVITAGWERWLAPLHTKIERARKRLYIIESKRKSVFRPISYIKKLWDNYVTTDYPYEHCYGARTTTGYAPAEEGNKWLRNYDRASRICQKRELQLIEILAPWSNARQKADEEERRANEWRTQRLRAFGHVYVCDREPISPVESQFWAKINENYRDHLPWLVYADWLEETGDPARTEEATMIRRTARIRDARRAAHNALDRYEVFAPNCVVGEERLEYRYDAGKTRFLSIPADEITEELYDHLDSLDAYQE